MILKKEISEEKEMIVNAYKIMILNNKLTNNIKKIDNLSYKQRLANKIMILKNCNTLSINLQVAINKRNEILNKIKQNNIENSQFETDFNILEDKINDEYSSINIINKTNERLNNKLVKLNHKLSNIIIDNNNNNDKISRLEVLINFKEIEIEDIYNKQIYKVGQDIAVLDRKLLNKTSSTNNVGLENNNELIVKKEKKFKQYQIQNDILLTNER